MAPRKQDLKMKVDRIAAASNGPATSPILSMSVGQRLPNWISTGMPEARLRTKASANTRTQKRYASVHGDLPTPSERILKYSSTHASPSSMTRNSTIKPTLEKNWICDNHKVEYVIMCASLEPVGVFCRDTQAIKPERGKMLTSPAISLLIPYDFCTEPCSHFKL